jgi:hypothetical protein
VVRTDGSWQLPLVRRPQVLEFPRSSWWLESEASLALTPWRDVGEAMEQDRIHELDAVIRRVLRA